MHKYTLIHLEVFDALISLHTSHIKTNLIMYKYTCEYMYIHVNIYTLYIGICLHIHVNIYTLIHTNIHLNTCIYM